MPYFLLKLHLNYIHISENKSMIALSQQMFRGTTLGQHLTSAQEYYLSSDFYGFYQEIKRESP